LINDQPDVYHANMKQIPAHLGQVDEVDCALILAQRQVMEDNLCRLSHKFEQVNDRLRVLVLPFGNPL
jgi:hypothetical protein